MLEIAIDPDGRSRLSCQITLRAGGESGAGVLTNVAVWESAEDLLNAFVSPAFQALLPEYPDGTVARPVLMRKLAVGNICVA